MHVTIQSAAITIENTDFVDNFGQRISEMFIAFQTDIRSSDVTFSMVNSTVHTKTHSDFGVWIEGSGANVQLTNTSMSFANIHFTGFVQRILVATINTRIHMRQLPIYRKL